MKRNKKDRRSLSATTAASQPESRTDAGPVAAGGGGRVDVRGPAGVAAATILPSKAPERAYPELRIAFSHGGGGFSITLPRMDQGWHTTPAMREAIPEPPRIRYPGGPAPGPSHASS